jgi:hypothetical protein
MQVDFRTSGGADKVYYGKIRYVGPSVRRQSRDAIVEAVFANEKKELDATIKRLTAMRDGLRHAVNCKAPSHMECPKFRRIVKAAAGQHRVRPR